MQLGHDCMGKIVFENMHLYTIIISKDILWLPEVKCKLSQMKSIINYYILHNDTYIPKNYQFKAIVTASGLGEKL